MRILVVNPVGHSTWNEADRRVYEEFSSPETEIEVTSLPKGPTTVETPEAYAEATYWVLRLVKKEVKSRRYDAFIVNCCLDPGVNLLKEVIEVPVIGPCKASLALASLIGKKPVVITVGKEGIWLIEDKVKALGYRDVEVKGIPVGVSDIDRDREYVKKLLVEAAKTSMNEGKDVVILGCTGLAGMAREIQKSVKTPVIDPAGAAIKAAEATVKLKLFNPVGEVM